MISHIISTQEIGVVIFLWLIYRNRSYLGKILTKELTRRKLFFALRALEIVDVIIEERASQVWGQY